MTEVRAYLAQIDDMGSLATPLDETSGWSWRTEINETGYGTLVVDHDDPLIADIDLPNSLVHFLIDDAPASASTIVLERYNAVDYDRDEERAEQTRFEGRGPAALFDRIRIDPSGGPDHLPIQEDRVLDYRDSAYDDSAWDNATEVCTVGDAQIEWPAGTTIGATLWDPDFPDPDASVLWTSEGTTASADVKDVYSRQPIANAYTGKAQLLVLGDNLGEAYWNGALIVTPGQAEDSNYSGWTRASTYVLDLNPGDAILALKWTNLGGPAGFAWALFEQDSDGVLGALIARSDTSATIIAATAPPGMTFGEAAIALYNEQTDRAGADPKAAANVTDFSFDPVDDSNGNPWGLVNLSTKVGTSFLTFLREASANAIDFKVTIDLDAGLAILHAYRKGEMGDTPGVSYHLPTDPDDATTGNLISVHRTGESPAGNDFLGRWGGGWTQRLNQSSIDTYGRWETTLAVGAINDLPEARRVLDGELAEFASPRVQTDIEIDPFDDSEIPWLGYAPEGATVDLLGVDHRILAATASVDDNTGELHLALTLNDSVVLTFDERLAQLTDKMVPFTLRGKSKVATQPIPRSVPRGIGIGSSVAAYTETFNKGDGAGWGPVLTWAGPGGPYNTETRSNAGTGADGEGVLGVPDADTVTSDMYVECTIADLEAPLDDAGWGVNLRGRLANRTSYTSGSTHYMLEIAYSVSDVSVRFQLRRHTALNAGGTIIATALTTLAEGDVVRLEVEGTAIRGKKNGTTILSTTDATYTTGTGAGLDVANFPIFPGVDPRHAVSVDTFRFGDL